MSLSHQLAQRNTANFNVRVAAICLLLLVTFATLSAHAGTMQNYIVLYHSKGVPTNASTAIKQGRRHARRQLRPNWSCHRPFR
jgi:hypothetical protein